MIKISARLLPSIAINAVWVSYSNDNSVFYFDFPDGTEYVVHDFYPGMGAHDIASIFAAMLSFLSSALESRDYRIRTGRRGDCEHLFPAHVLDHFECLADDIGMLQSELEGGAS